MGFRFVFVICLFRSVTSATEDGPLCVPYGNERICSSMEVPNGKTYTELLKGVMSINVDRKGQLEFTPTKFKSDSIPTPEGVLEENTKLDEKSTLQFDFLSGPESIAKQGDTLYAAATNAIYKVNIKSKDFSVIYDGNTDCPVTKTCSRPLGLRVHENELFCADGVKGLVHVNLENGESNIILPVGTMIKNKPLNFPDDLDVDFENNIVYLSDASSKWDLDEWTMSTLESENSGRVIRVNVTSGKAEVFCENLRFANGVQISHDKKFLLVNEFTARRTLKFPLDGSLPVFGNTFVQHLPGNPDNIRPSLSGGYWVALVLSRSNGSRTLLDELQARPDLNRKLGNSMLTYGSTIESMGMLLSNNQLQVLGTQMKTGIVLLRSMPRVGSVLELDANGKILQILQSQKYDFFTEALEDEDGLLLASFVNKFILKVPRAAFRNVTLIKEEASTE